MAKGLQSLAQNYWKTENMTEPSIPRRLGLKPSVSNIIEILLLCGALLLLGAGCNNNTLATNNPEKAVQILKLDAETEIFIRHDYFRQLGDTNVDFKDIFIKRYYGTYAGSIAVIMAINGAFPPPAIDEIEVEGFVFLFNTGWHITIWHEGEYYSIQNAYSAGLLTIDDLRTINKLSKEYSWTKD